MRLSQLFSISCTVVVCAAVTTGASPVNAQDVLTTSYTSPSGERVLRHELEVDAPLADVWRTFTTADGLRSFLAPVVGLDFRAGGKLETSYSATAHLGDSANIVSEIVAYLPMEMFVTRIVQTPPTFQNPDVAKRLWTVYQFRAVTERRTRIVVSMAGWQTGPEWDAVYRFFDRGNAFTMREVQRRFGKGSPGS